MARYIDADKLKDNFCDACATLKRYKRTVEGCRNKIDSYGNRCFKMRLIDTTPTADVVPKSEVDLYRKQVDELEDELATAYDKLEKARSDVSREIFEELEFDIHQLMFERDETRAIAIEGVIAALKNETLRGRDTKLSGREKMKRAIGLIEGMACVSEDKVCDVLLSTANRLNDILEGET